MKLFLPKALGATQIDVVEVECSMLDYDKEPGSVVRWLSDPERPPEWWPEAVVERWHPACKLGIGQAVLLLHGGCCVRRAAWANGSYIYVDRVLSPYDPINLHKSGLNEVGPVPWKPRQDDLLAEDWELV